MTDWAYAVLICLYVLVGRWNLDRLIGRGLNDLDYLTLEVIPFSITQIRFWLVPALVALALLERRPRGAGARAEAGALAAALFLFFLYLLVSALWAPDLAFAAHKAWEVAIVALVTAVVYRVMTGPRGPAVRERFWVVMIAVTACLALIALGKAATSDPDRLSVLGGGPNVFGRLMGLLCLGSLLFWRKSGSWLYLPLCVASILLIILSGSRGCLISTGLAVLLFFAFERIRPARLAAMALVAGLALAAILTSTGIGRKAVNVYQLRVVQLTVEEGYTSGRDSIYHDAWELGKANAVLGAGLSGFRGLRYGVYPHNLFLEVFSEGGAVGISLLALVLALCLRAYWANGARADGAILAALVLILGSSQFSGDLYDSRALFLLLLMALPPKDSRQAR